VRLRRRRRRRPTRRTGEPITFNRIRSFQMNTIAKVVIVAVIAAGVAGCDQLALDQTRTEQTGGKTNGEGRSDYLADLAVRSEEDQKDHRSAAEAALEWMKKYSKAADELAQVQRTNRELREKNQTLLARNAKLLTEHEAMKRELEEASAMTVEMRRELNVWKANVLGFREEMKKAEDAELVILTRIMVLLGGAAPPSSPKDTPARGPATQPAGDKNADDDAGKDLTRADKK